MRARRARLHQFEIPARRTPLGVWRAGARVTGRQGAAATSMPR